jgi:hypothetical protein
VFEEVTGAWSGRGVEPDAVVARGDIRWDKLIRNWIIVVITARDISVDVSGPRARSNIAGGTES